MIAGPRVLVLAILLFPVSYYADAQTLPWPGEPGATPSAPPASKETLRFRLEQCVREVRRRAREAQRREFPPCDSAVAQVCFNIYGSIAQRSERKFDEERERAKCFAAAKAQTMP
jgi:hypothetical protein